MVCRWDRGWGLSLQPNVCAISPITVFVLPINDVWISTTNKRTANQKRFYCTLQVYAVGSVYMINLEIIKLLHQDAVLSDMCDAYQNLLDLFVCCCFMP